MHVVNGQADMASHTPLAPPKSHYLAHLKPKPRLVEEPASELGQLNASQHVVHEVLIQFGMLLTSSLLWM